MGQQYSLTFVNNSTNSWDFCLYQQDPNIETNPNPMVLAWFAQQIDPGSQATYSWTIEYGFVWSYSGLTANGAVKFSATENIPADLSMKNQITLSNDGAFKFGPVSQNSTSGTLFINEDATIPLNKAYVGISMAGNGTFAVAAEPNIPALTFTPDPEYWCTFGTYEVGQVMNIGEITSPQQIIYNGVFDHTVTLNADNTWSIS